ncbi:translation initiation factor IF-2 [Desulfohalotomaculum tongense]|uniref:translation initiation factor IF-2 n=1 Tax=Desulforadius tongensis TaxID=1216062 RepID=UPI00195B2749|nr:translation initiation factor IF-2 [Desulforadius tongensis]MBM7854439.1 translation initiation factor IF-2 [Desulforadius tongensis]
MTKKRVHELAKELNIESKEVIKGLNELGINVKSALSMVEDQDAKKLKNLLLKEDSAANKAKKSSGKGKKSYDKGPGIVDRVPSRPPDRRYDERRTNNSSQGRPQTKNVRKGSGRPEEPAAKNTKQYERKQGAKGQGNRPQGNKPHGKPQGKPQGSRVQGNKIRGNRPKGGRPPKERNISIPKMDPVVSAQAKAKAQERPRNEQRIKSDNFTSRDRWLEEQDRREDNKKLKKQRHNKKKQQSKTKNERQLPGQPLEKKPITIGESITVQGLAEKLRLTAADVIKTLMGLGVMATINQEIDSDTATLVAAEFGYEVNVKIEEDIEEIIMAEPEDDEESLQPRPPVVTVMGHVDHGKTSLLDAIRETKVTASEAGGITQHIGAYQVEKDGKKITFLDTPGHAAFTAMRARGARVTDIAILVVAADDGVMPQTVEAINHAKAAGVPIIVAINKIDKPEANPDRVRQELAQHGLVVEQWGGDVISVEVSAIKRTGLDELLEMILLVAEISELKANPNRKARGTVIEAELDKGRGPVATVLVQSGTLKVGEPIVVGTAYGRVRAMMDYMGRRVKSAGPSTPVKVLGLNSVPEAGDIFVAVEEEKIARTVAEQRINKKKEKEQKQAAKLSLDDLFKNIQEGTVKELPIIIKADVQGSVEALKQAINNLSNDEVKVSVVHGGVGAITETDIMLASASNAIVIGFNVRPDVNARKVAETEKVDMRMYRVIYDAIEDIKAAMSGLLEPEYREVVLGRAEVRKIFKVSKIGTIAGSYVTEGKITRDAGVRIIRDGIVVHEGKLDTLKRFKDDVKEVVQGYECGITIEKFNDIQEGDIIEAFTEEEIKRELE